MKKSTHKSRLMMIITNRACKAQVKSVDIRVYFIIPFFRQNRSGKVFLVLTRQEEVIFFHYLLACKANATENCELYSIYGCIGIVDSMIFQMIS